MYTGTGAVKDDPATVAAAEAAIHAKYGWRFRATRVINALPDRVFHVGTTQAGAAVESASGPPTEPQCRRASLRHGAAMVTGGVRSGQPAPRTITAASATGDHQRNAAREHRQADEQAGQEVSATPTDGSTKKQNGRLAPACRSSRSADGTTGPILAARRRRRVAGARCSRRWRRHGGSGAPSCTRCVACCGGASTGSSRCPRTGRCCWRATTSRFWTRWRSCGSAIGDTARSGSWRRLSCGASGGCASSSSTPARSPSSAMAWRPASRSTPPGARSTRGSASACLPRARPARPRPDGRPRPGSGDSPWSRRARRARRDLGHAPAVHARRIVARPRIGVAASRWPSASPCTSPRTRDAVRSDGSHHGGRRRVGRAAARTICPQHPKHQRRRLVGPGPGDGRAPRHSSAPGELSAATSCAPVVHWAPRARPWAPRRYIFFGAAAARRRARTSSPAGRPSAGARQIRSPGARKRGRRC